MDQEGDETIFAATTTVAGERVTVVVTGEVDMSTAGRMMQAATGERTATVTLDLRGVTFFDSAAIHALVRLAERYPQDAFEVMPSDQVRRVLEISGLGGQPWLRTG